MKSIISKFVTILWLVYAAEETGLSLDLSETPKTGFVVSRPIMYSNVSSSRCFIFTPNLIQVISIHKIYMYVMLLTKSKVRKSGLFSPKSTSDNGQGMPQ